MAGPGTPTLDQLRVFLAVVETGSFAAAGRRLNRAVSVISYGIGNLEEQLGLTLFDRAGTRKPQLTVEGRAVLSEARGIAQGVDELRAKVKGLLEGLEAEVNLAVDVMLPADRLGRELPSLQLCRRLEPGELFLLSVTNPASFDSRYFGPVSASTVIGVAHPVWLESRP